MSSSKNEAVRLEQHVEYIRRRGFWLEMILPPEGDVYLSLYTPPDKDGGQASVLEPANVSSPTIIEALDLIVARLKKEKPE